MVRTASNSGKLNGRTPLEFVTGETVDISEYMDFDFYDRVWFKQYSGVVETKIGRWIGVAQGYESLMNYWDLPQSGIPVSSTTVKRITEVEYGLEANKDRFKALDMKVLEKSNNRKLSDDGSINPEDWKELVDNDEAFVQEFEKVFYNTYVSDADDFYPDNFDGYVNMEIAIDRGGEEPQLSKVVK